MNFFLRAMQASVAPITVISGLAFLLTIVATRYGRCIDRVRQLLAELHTTTQPRLNVVREQIDIIYQRARLLRTTMLFVTLSIFSVVVTVSLIFSSYILGWESDRGATFFFLLALASIVAALLLFFRDITISLRALKLEIQSEYKGLKSP